ncbi:MAG: GTPase domain-containing protein [bacterium]
MTECLVTGMTNAGKTCFVINFAEYMGLKELKIYVRQLAGYTSVTNYTPMEAKKEFVSVESNFTRNIQSVKLEIPSGKSIKELEIIDSCGLSNGIHPEEEIRMAMAQTIHLIRKSKLVLHMIDITNINLNGQMLLPLDKMIMEYASMEKNYVILANKIDLLYAGDNLKILKNHIKDKVIIPISALYQKGFKEVKKLVLTYV